jgi:hypothetical protein
MIDPSAQSGPGHAAGGDQLKLDAFLPYRFNVCSSLVTQVLSRIYAELYRMGVPEWRVLVTLSELGPMTAKAAATATHTPMAHEFVCQLMETVDPADRAALDRARTKLIERSAQLTAGIATAPAPR